MIGTVSNKRTYYIIQCRVGGAGNKWENIHKLLNTEMTREEAEAFIRRQVECPLNDLFVDRKKTEWRIVTETVQIVTTYGESQREKP